MHKIIALFLTTLAASFFATSIYGAEKKASGNALRFRLIQAANIGNGVELESYKVGEKTYEMNSTVSKNGGLLVLLGKYGVGYYDFQTKIDQSDDLLTHSLEAKFYEVAYLINTPGNSSLAFGGGLPFSGKGRISYPYNNSDLVSEEVMGYSWFAQVGLEYTLPVNLSFTGMDFAEVLLGYRQHYLEYSDYQSGSTKLSKPQLINSSQYQFGLGFVF